MSALGIKLPLRIRELEESFGIDDAAGRSVAYIYFCDEEQRRGVIGRFAKTEAKAIAIATARALTAAAESCG